MRSARAVQNRLLRLAIPPEVSYGATARKPLIKKHRCPTAPTGTGASKPSWIVGASPPAWNRSASSRASRGLSPADHGRRGSTSPGPRPAKYRTSPATIPPFRPGRLHLATALDCCMKGSDRYAMNDQYQTPDVQSHPEGGTEQEARQGRQYSILTAEETADSTGRRNTGFH